MDLQYGSINISCETRIKGPKMGLRINYRGFTAYLNVDIAEKNN